jgi:hypothetical protein
MTAATITTTVEFTITPVTPGRNPCEVAHCGEPSSRFFIAVRFEDGHEYHMFFCGRQHTQADFWNALVDIVVNRTDEPAPPDYMDMYETCPGCGSDDIYHEADLWDCDDCGLQFSQPARSVNP